MIFSVLALETISSANVVTNTLMLTNNAEYALVSCDLGMSARKTSALGGASPYTDVPVTLTVHVIGTTAARCAAAMDRLVTTVAQARRWQNRESVDGVRLRMRLQGGTVDYICLLLGPEDDEPPTSFVIEEDAINTPNTFMVRNVALRFIRRGLLAKTTAETATSAATNLKEIGSCTFATSCALPTPTAITVNTSGSNGSFAPGLVLVTARNGLTRLNAALGSGTGSSVSDTAGRAVGGNVRQLTAPGGTLTTGLSAALDWRQLAVFVTVRVNTAGGVWTIAASMDGGAAGPAVEVTEDATNGNPTPLFLGLFAARLGFTNNVSLACVGNTGTLDIDNIYLARVDLPAFIVDVRADSTTGFLRSSVNNGVIQPRDLTDREPFVGSYVVATGVVNRAYASYQGDVFITSEGDGLSFVFLDGGFATSFWREGSGTTSATDTVTATRYPAALTPQ